MTDRAHVLIELWVFVGLQIDAFLENVSFALFVALFSIQNIGFCDLKITLISNGLFDNVLDIFNFRDTVVTAGILFLRATETVARTFFGRRRSPMKKR